MNAADAKRAAQYCATLGDTPLEGRIKAALKFLCPPCKTVYPDGTAVWSGGGLVRDARRSRVGWLRGYRRALAGARRRRARAPAHARLAAMAAPSSGVHPGAVGGATREAYTRSFFVPTSSSARYWL